MDTVSLYRKYRPHNFDNLIGQDHIKSTLINALQAGRAAHAYLFTGPRGTGKTSTARLVAKALNCENLQGGFEPCDKCEICKDINTGRLIDLIEIDAASNRGIDEVRDLKEKINFAPSHAKCKVYIIDEVHMMTNEAFNALLKTLEEPPEHAYFILATTEIHKIPATIISRCQRFDFRRISEKAIFTRLSFIAQEEGIAVEEAALEAIAKYVAGGLRDAIGLLEQLTSQDQLNYDHVHEILGVSDMGQLDNLFAYLQDGDVRKALDLVHELYSQGSDIQQFLHEYIDLLRKKMLESVNEGKQEMTGYLLKKIEIFQKAFDNFNANLPQLALEIAVIRATDSFEIPRAVPRQEKKVEKAPEPEPQPQPEVAPEPEVPAEPVKTEEPVESAVEATAEPEPEVKPEASQIDLALKDLVDQWPRVTERVSQPALRMSMQNAKPIELKGIDLTLQFGSNFHRDKVMEGENRSMLERLLGDLCGTNLKLKAEVKAVEIKPVMQEPTPAPAPSFQEPQPEKQDMTNEALDIFGGELVE